MWPTIRRSTASGGTGSIDALAVSNIQNAIAGLIVPAGGSNSLSITGTPTATGTETFTVTATDALGDNDLGELQHHGQQPHLERQRHGELEQRGELGGWRGAEPGDRHPGSGRLDGLDAGQ